MAKKIINIGRSANDKSGDPIRVAFSKVNDNFTELYAYNHSETYHLGDSDIFVDLDPATGIIVIQSQFDSSMPVYIKGATLPESSVALTLGSSTGKAAILAYRGTGYFDISSTRSSYLLLRS